MSDNTHAPAPLKGGKVSFETTIQNVRHLLVRAGFGATPDQIMAAARQGLDATIQSSIDYQQIPDTLTPPDQSIANDMKDFQIAPLAQWWLGQMIATSRPLQEKMTLFWHGHFATANYKVNSPALMYQQNQTLRANAMGRFDDLLTAVYKDPAMLIWLDGRLNVKQAPNENFGREVMELFTLGVGNYTEDDVQANSRAFTGWRLTYPEFQVVFVPRLHDDGVKTLLDQTGNWGSDDAVRILSTHPATGPFLAGKLWRFFASDEASAGILTKMAAAYYNSDHSIQAMVQVMLSAPEFYSELTRVTHVKSPVDFLVTTIRQLGLTGVDLTTFPRILTLLGQELFNPPTVGGWTGGTSWINGGTMLTRFNVASRLVGDSPVSMPAFDISTVLYASNAESMSELVYFIANTLGIELSAATEAALLQYAGNQPMDSNVDLVAKTAGLLHLVLVSPEYQIA